MSKYLDIALDARPLSMANTGVAKYILMLTHILLDDGHRVTLVTNRPLTSDDPAIDKCQVRIMPGKYRFWWEQVSLLRLLNASRYDLYIATWNFGLPFFYKGSTKLLLVVHDLIYLKLPKIYMRRLRVKIPFLVSLKISLSKADRILTVSKASADDINGYFPGKKIEYGFPPVILGPLPKRIQTTKPYFVYVGGVDPRKNIDTLLRAFQKFLSSSAIPYELMLIGSGYGMYDSLIQELRIGGSIIKTGYISDAEKLQALVNSNGLFYPSSYEGYGIPVLEGIMCDTPVVTGTCGALREVGGEAALYVEPGNAGALAGAMTKLGDTTTLEKLRAGREQQKLAFAKNDFPDKILALVYNIVETGN